MTNSSYKLGLLFVTSEGECEEKVAERKQCIKEILEDNDICSQRCEEDSVTCKTVKIQTKLCAWCDEHDVDIILTFGGVEFSPLDIVPEATKGVIDREALNLTVALIKQSLDSTPLTVLSRSFCGIRGSSLIINLSNDVKQLKASIQVISPLLGNIVQSLKGERTLTVISDIALEAARLEQAEFIQPDDYGSDEGTETNQLPDVDLTKEPEQDIENVLDPEDKKGNEDLTTTNITEPPLKLLPDTPQIVEQLESRSPELTTTLTKNTLHTRKQSFKNIVRADDPSSSVTDDYENDNTDREATSTSSKSYDVMTTETSFDQSTADVDSDPSDDGSDSSGNCASEIHPEENLQIDVTNQKTETYASKILLKRLGSGTNRILNLRNKYIESTFKKDSMTVTNTKVNKLLKATTRTEKDTESMDYYYATSVAETESYKETGHSGMDVQKRSASLEDVYDFDSGSDSEEEGISSKITKSSKTREKTFKKARIYHNYDQNKEITFVPVGDAMMSFLKSHPSIGGIYLNKGKRQIKKTLVTLKRQETAVDKGSWERKGHRLERNRFDDYFEATEAGEKKKEEIGQCRARDEYVVNWYVWCPGHGNCHRKCGGYGECIEGCSGMAHKQDRHNCSFLVNCKIFLSDLTKWRVQLTGCHVPDDAPLPWMPPAVDRQRMNQDTRDFIISQFQAKNVCTSTVQEAFLKEQQNSTSAVLTKRKISRVMWGLKKRKSEKNVSQSHSTTVSNVCVSGATQSMDNQTLIPIQPNVMAGQLGSMSPSSSHTSLPNTINSITAVDLSSSLNVSMHNMTAVDLSSSCANTINSVVDLSSRHNMQSSLTAVVDQSPRLTVVDTSPRFTMVDTSPRLTVVDTSPRFTVVDTSPRLTVLDQSPRLTMLDQSSRLNMTDQPVIIINQDMLQRVGECDPSGIDVTELIQNSEIPEGEMSSSDLRAVLLSLYNQQ